jgi:copper resistance protein D
MLVGSVASLVGTDYGRLLLLKIALFCVMLAIAGVNRIVLTPRLNAAHGGAQYLLRQLRINSVIEATIGMIILVIVGVLGTLPPGIQEHAASLR